MVNRNGLGVALLCATLAIGCGGRMPEDLGAKGEVLGGCPASPNCVSSAASDAEHAIDAFAIVGDPQAAWAGLRATLQAQSDVELVSDEARYVHAVFTTSLMRYRDDVEFLLRSEAQRIEVRSASRVGYSDMGANRKRVERLRATLAEKGWIHPARED